MSTAAPPQPGDFQEPLQQVLAFLFSSKKAGTDWLTASEISSSLLKDYGISLHWKTIETILSNNPEFAARRKKNKKWQFTITTAGQEQVSSGNNPILFVNPVKAVQAVLNLHQFFATLKGSVRICDPYFDVVTLQHLEAFTGATAIRLLTSNISDTPTLRLALTALSAQGKSVEIRKPAKDVLHDRYVIDDSTMLILGTSLNSFGKKQCFVIKAGQDITSALLENFKQLWDSAKVWP
jgi:hypothetical protein